MPGDDTANEKANARFSVRRLAPLVVLAAGLAVVLVFDLDRYLAFDTLKDNRDSLSEWVARERIAAAAAFIAVYVVVTALSVPGAAILTMAGGFLFGAALGTVCSVVAATLGAVVVFSAAKTGLGEPLKAKAGPRLKKMEAGFGKNAFSYLLILRLMPVFPFWLVNLAPAFLGVPVRTFLAATFIGIIPGGFVYALVGAGLGSIFEGQEDFSVSAVMTPEIIAALIGLAVLSAVPIIYRRLKSRRRPDPDD
jgi:uncharacterized membrane protein YdjX (TVP38/TMEM64 family)